MSAGNFPDVGSSNLSRDDMIREIGRTRAGASDERA